MAKETMRPKSQKMRCKDCGEKILQDIPEHCPYCGGANLVPEEEVDFEEIEKLERAGRYEDAALKYEEAEMWDKAGEERRKAKTSYVISANVNIGKVGTISMECPHCGASQPLSSKNSEVTCKYCGKNYIIPKKVLELL
jgi:DNA-directed RNA polymerase subunit RPC12/RpoP